MTWPPPTGPGSAPRRSSKSGCKASRPTRPAFRNEEEIMRFTLRILPAALGLCLFSAGPTLADGGGGGGGDKTPSCPRGEVYDGRRDGYVKEGRRRQPAQG